jgi:hypothetical protein
MLELATDEDRTFDTIVELARTAVRRDRAEVICFGCAGMADPTSKSLTYAPSRPKGYLGWPPSLAGPDRLRPVTGVDYAPRPA